MKVQYYFSEMFTIGHIFLANPSPTSFLSENAFSTAFNLVTLKKAESHI